MKHKFLFQVNAVSRKTITLFFMMEQENKNKHNLQSIKNHKK